MKTQTIGADYSTAQRLIIFAACVLGFAFDLYNILIFPFLMGVIQKDLHISLTYSTSINTVTLIGSVMGGVLFGGLGDRLGRKKAFLLTLGLFAIGSIASAFVWNYWSLVAIRFITGIGLGGEWGAGMVLLNEVTDRKHRGIASSLVQGSSTAAAAAAAVIGVWAISSFSLEWGWRVAFLTGGSPLILMIFIQIFMPESKVWAEYDQLRKAGKLPVVTEQKTASMLDIFRGALLPRTLTCMALTTGLMFCYYCVIVFMPTYMLGGGRVAPETVRTATLIGTAFNALAYVVMGFASDRFGRRFGAVVPCAFWIVSLLALFWLGGRAYGGSVLLWPLCWVYVLFNIGNAAFGVVGPWMSELYPTHVRATAISLNYMAGRGIGSIGLVAVPLAAAAFGNNLGLGMMIALPAALLFLGAAILLPETLGRNLSLEGASTLPAPDGNPKTAVAAEHT